MPLSQADLINDSSGEGKNALVVVLLGSHRCLHGPSFCSIWKSRSLGLLSDFVRLPCLAPSLGLPIVFQVNSDFLPLLLNLEAAPQVQSPDRWCGCHCNLRSLDGTAGSLFPQRRPPWPRGGPPPETARRARTKRGRGGGWEPPAASWSLSVFL